MLKAKKTMEAVSNFQEYQNIAKEMLQLETTWKMLLFLLCLLSAGYRMLMGCLLIDRYVSSITDSKCHRIPKTHPPFHVRY